MSFGCFKKRTVKGSFFARTAPRMKISDWRVAQLGTDINGDMEKYNAAACLGWRILRTVPEDICTNDTLELIRKAAATNPAIGEGV